MHEALADGQKFRTFNVLHDYTRQGLGIEGDFGLPSDRIVRCLDQIIERRGKPKVTRCDNGGEMCSATFQNWANDHLFHSIEFAQLQMGDCRSWQSSGARDD
jgi:putative transposase